QDVLGREAPCTLTTETVRGDRLAAHRAPHRYDRVSGPRPLVRTRSSPGGRRPPARPLLVIGRRSRGDLSADMVLNYELHWTPVPRPDASLPRCLFDRGYSMVEQIGTSGRETRAATREQPPANFDTRCLLRGPDDAEQRRHADTMASAIVSPDTPERR